MLVKQRPRELRLTTPCPPVSKSIEHLITLRLSCPIIRFILSLPPICRSVRRFHLTSENPDGNIVHKSGLPVTHRLLDRLSSLGITSVTVKSEIQDAINPKDALASSCDPEVFATVSHLLAKTTERLSGIFQNLQNSVPVSTTEIQENVSAFVEQIAAMLPLYSVFLP